MKILFCGTNVPDEIEYQVRDISAAGNRFQNNLIANLRKCGHEVVPCVYLGVPVPEELREKLGDTVIVRSDGFIKSLWRYRKCACKLLDDTDIALCYNTIYAWLFLPIWTHRRGKRCVAVIAGYSEPDSYSRWSLKIYAWLQCRSMRRFDTVVGLSEAIRAKLRGKQRFIRVEGGIDRALYDALGTEAPEHPVGSPITILYSGLLNSVQGVDLLLDAMRQVTNRDIRMYISGKGELEQTVREAERMDGRVRYLGFLPYEEYIQRLREADIFINPRNMTLSENQNNFPSKIMDYLAAGKPILSTRFAGWERFRENAVFCDSDPQSVARAIETLPELLARAEDIYCTNRKRAEDFLWEKQIAVMLGEESNE